MVDVRRFSDLARIRVLLVPLHPIKQERLERYADLIKSIEHVKLQDVPSDGRQERALFSTRGQDQGCLLFRYETPTEYSPTHNESFLNEFQISRRVQAIIGVLDASEHEGSSLRSALDSFYANMQGLPDTFVYKVFAFDATAIQMEEARKLHDSDTLVVIAGGGDTRFFLGAMLSDMSKDILRELSNCAAQVESKVDFPTPQEKDAPKTPFRYKPTQTAGSAEEARLRDEWLRRERERERNRAHGAASAQLLHPDVPEIDTDSLGLAPPPMSRTAVGGIGASQSGNKQGFLYGKNIQARMELQPEAAPAPPTTNDIVDGKARRKVAGREKKLLADLALLAGRVSHAVKWYQEAIILTKSHPQDQVWLASAQEGLAVSLILQLWGPASARLNLSDTKHMSNADFDLQATITQAIEHLKQAIELYKDKLTAQGESAVLDGLEGYDPANPTIIAPDTKPLDPDPAHPVVYGDACLRMCRLLYALWDASPEHALNNLVADRPDDRFIQEVSSSTSLVSMGKSKELPALPPSANSQVSSSAQVHPAELARAAVDTRLKALRRHAQTSFKPTTFMIAHWASAICDSAFLYIAPAQRLRFLSVAAAVFRSIGYRRKEAFLLREITALCTETPLAHLLSQRMSLPQGASAIAKMVDKVSSAYGVSIGEEEEASANEMITPLSEDLLYRGPQYGWRFLQVGVARDAIAACLAVGAYGAVQRLAIASLRTLGKSMSLGDQRQIVDFFSIAKALSLRSNIQLAPSFMGPEQLILALELAPLSPSRFCFKNEAKREQRTSLSHRQSTFYYYDPRMEKRNSRVVFFTAPQGETITVHVTLSNPWLFSIAMRSISLETQGVPFDAKPFSAVLPPSSIQTIRLSGVPLGEGTLSVVGCRVLLQDSSTPIVVAVPIKTASSDQVQKISLMANWNRVKHVGVNAVQDAAARFSSAMAAYRKDPRSRVHLQCTIIPSMPLLETENPIHFVQMHMGESTQLTLSVKNISSIPISAVASHGTLDPASCKGDVIQIRSSADGETIPPYATQNILVTCLGVKDLSSAQVHVDYTSVPGEYWRRLSFHIVATILPAPYISMMRLLPLSQKQCQLIVTVENPAQRPYVVHAPGSITPDMQNLDSDARVIVVKTVDRIADAKNVQEYLGAHLDLTWTIPGSSVSGKCLVDAPEIDTAPLFLAPVLCKVDLASCDRVQANAPCNFEITAYNGSAEVQQLVAELVLRSVDGRVAHSLSSFVAFHMSPQVSLERVVPNGTSTAAAHLTFLAKGSFHLACVCRDVSTRRLVCESDRLDVRVS